jgi:hypothetical protein
MAKKVKRPAKKAVKKTAKKTAKKAVKAKTGGRGSKLEGEGSYTASRNYDRGTEKFIARNKGRIGKMAKDAETALEGPEGKSLRAAEKAGRARARR